MLEEHAAPSDEATGAASAIAARARARPVPPRGSAEAVRAQLGRHTAGHGRARARGGAARSGSRCAGRWIRSPPSTRPRPSRPRSRRRRRAARRRPRVRPPRRPRARVTRESADRRRRRRGSFSLIYVVGGAEDALDLIAPSAEDARALCAELDGLVTRARARGGNGSGGGADGGGGGSDGAFPRRAWHDADADGSGELEKPEVPRSSRGSESRTRRRLSRR